MFRPLTSGIGADLSGISTIFKSWFLTLTIYLPRTMNTKVDVCISFYGKPYQAIVTIKTLMKYSAEHIDKIYIIRERRQPHDDYIGIFKIIDYFRHDPAIKLVIAYPHYFLGTGAHDYERAKTDQRWRLSIMHQYAFEKTDKKYLCLTHNDMLYHGDIIGEMLRRFSQGAENLVGIGSIGQCWSCPAGPDWGRKCGPTHFEEFVPDKEQAIALTTGYNTPRQSLQLKVISEGRIHPLPECRLNEFCALIDVDKYRKETIPNGDIGCFGANWGGIDTGTVWSHDMYNRGYTFRHITLEDYATHSPFDGTGSGTTAYSKADLYWSSEQKASEYLAQNFGPFRFSATVYLRYAWDTAKRYGWLGLIHTYGLLKKLVGK